MKLHVNLGPSPLLFFLLILVLWILVFLYYRKTRPKIMPRDRLLCMVLRGTAMSLILWLLFKPVIDITIRKTEKPRIVILTDVSASMTISDNNIRRSSKLQDFFKSEDYSVLKKNASLDIVTFSDQIHEVNDSEKLEFHGTSTNITGALDQTLALDKQRPIRAVLLLTDGCNNTGLSPENRAQKWDVPIYTVGYGSSEDKPDIVITEVLSNKTAFVNEEIPIRISLRSPGFGGKASSVVMRTQNQETVRLPVNFAKEGLETTVEFHWIPLTSGYQRLIFSVDSLPGELTPSNNQRECIIHVKKQKQRVLLLAGAPCPDLGCLRRLFSRDDHMDLIIRTQKPGGRFYEGSLTSGDFQSFDMVVLLNMPTYQTSSAFWQNFSNLYEQIRWPILIIAGESVDRDRFVDFHEEQVIYSFGTKSLKWVLPDISEKGLQHPVPLVDDNVSESRFRWQQLPPVPTFWPYATVMPDAEILVTGQIDNDSNTTVPLVIARSFEGTRHITILAGSLYRWQLLMWQENSAQDLFNHFIMNCVHWLTADDRTRPVRLIVENQEYQAGASVDLSAEVYDEGLQPVNDAVVRLMTVGQGDTSYTLMKPEGEGRYRTRLVPLVTGQYQLIAEATIQGRILGQDTTGFTVTAFNPEFLDTRAHPEVLRFISKKTGGLFVPSDSIGSVLSMLPVFQETVEKKKQVKPDQHAAVLVIILILISAEWWIRRRKGIV